ncbi:MraY family glycosyltransferase [Myceligenerans pegani]|uniref:Undecaprenyl/decaprenyl-phosphate alpha-N-acetylglucosaminyl 1-phosphate transferase n=1 Tax=Myceligenerans pegani TaxID=2776917 RepID=A0ABR9MTZ2_9MICO|nr:MraY family glycosyltransferase [Myceligenerans sp. TRM 65318]MBE1874847.1 undecaprenyl/decaprenyl-phosphate alpha-N-acetylglucosaminyl 1-phosphate transferase [Myceligenerans sp. TRM 65318]MBE3017118.1 undecaprenyl/decaprenyl-phosphate alpha-N-acetylglucosaminyl 1-phosphate transferase [Myceligenerans sp. TRM 65318]
MRVYLLLMLVAAAVTFLTTPAARWVALRTSAISAVRARDVHSVPTPRAGGLAIMLGIVVAVLLASRMPFLEDVFSDRQVLGIVGGALIVCLLGWADDVWDLDWLTKLAGQVLAAGFMALNEVQLVTIPTPGGLTIPSSRLSLIATVLIVVIAMNAVNFVDGLDGLAAGIIAIGGAAFFLYTYRLTAEDTPDNYASLAAMMMAVLVGVCVGFLPHNFFPSRIFMGDSGSMVLGLVMAGAAITVTGNVKPDVMTGVAAIPALFPLLLPVGVLMLPLTDMAMAVVRRLAAGKSPMAPDRLHLHHRMLALGHSHRRAVLILYVWTAVFAFGAAALVEWNWRIVMSCTAVAVLLALVVTMGPLRHRGRFLDDDAALQRASQDRAPEPGSGALRQVAAVAERPVVTTQAAATGRVAKNEESNV